MYSSCLLAVGQLCEHDKVRIHTEVKSEMRTGFRDRVRTAGMGYGE